MSDTFGSPYENISKIFILDLFILKYREGNYPSLDGGIQMSKAKSIMSENLKEEIAKELGVYDQVKKDGGWQNVSSKTCGNIVSKAIEIANRNIE